MVYNLDRKQMELKYLYKYLFAMIQYPCRWGYEVCRYRQNSECLIFKMEALFFKMEALFF